MGNGIASVNASEELNLKSDGHGGWLDTRGKFVAKTVDGKLKFTGKRGPKADEDLKKKPTAPQLLPFSKPK